MRLKILGLVALSAVSAALQARPVIDSVGVENQNGKKVILHKLEVKETYYGIARRYKVKPQAIIQFNNNIALHPGDVIKVPTDIPFAQVIVQTQPQVSAGDAGTIVQYKVAQHEYLYGIAKRFGTTVEDIKKLNNLKSDVLAPGQLISIHQGAGTQTTTTTVQQQPVKQAPAPTIPKPVMIAPPAVTQIPQPVSAVNTGEPGTIVQYKVTKREYLYSVAKRFNTTVESIKKLNNLTDNGLKPGMVLNIRQGAEPSTTTVVQQPASHPTDTIPGARRDSTTVAGIADSLNNKRATSRYGLFEKNEKGMATWMDDPSFDPNKKLILHRTAPIGTVVKITNPMTNRTTFAKVVGRFTDNESTKDVLIVMTKNVAESLGAIDKRFRVNISYGVPNE